jgi:uncharacterized protein YlxW (UPF0749 family)
MASSVHQAGAIASETPLRQGTAVLPATGAGVASLIVVNDVNITATSVIVVNGGAAAVDTTNTSYSVDTLVPGASFTIRSGAQMTAARTVNFAVLRY